MPRRLALVTFPLLIWAATAGGARADQAYRMTGRDSFTVGSHDVASDIEYSGEQTLVLVHQGMRRTYSARARYTRTDGTLKSNAQAAFASTILPDGEQHDDDDRDPDYLTVLNQPFAIELDAATLRDLGMLHKREAFDFASPITGEPLSGFLEPIGYSVLAGSKVLGVSFSAEGPMRGPLPDRPDLHLSGTIRMTGRAYYRCGDSLLLSIDATLAITGSLSEQARDQDVTIVYRRTIRPIAATTTREARSTPP